MSSGKLDSSQIYWITDLQGLNQRQDMDKIPDNYSPYLINIAVDKPGTWRKRPGSKLLSGASRAGSGINCLAEYVQHDGTRYIRVIYGTKLDNYDPTTDTYTNVLSGFTSDNEMQSTNYLNRQYYFSTTSDMSYDAGVSFATPVVSIRGYSIAQNQNTLYLGGITQLNGVNQNYQDRTYYSQFDNTNNTGTNQFFKDTETLATSTNWFSIQSPVVGLFPYGSTGLLYVFSDHDCYSWDQINPNNGTGPKKVFDKGLAGKFAITTCNNWMIWMDAEYRMWAWGGAGQPMPIAWELEDDSLRESILSSLSGSIHIAAGSLGNLFYFSIGNVTHKGETLNNVVLVGLMTQSSKAVLWSVYTFPVRPWNFTVATFSGSKVLLFGAYGVNDVYQLGYGVNDNATAVNARFRTKFYDMGVPFKTKMGNKVYIKYRPQASTNCFLKVKWAVDGSTNYTSLSDPDNATPLVKYGVVNMYDATSSSKFDQVKVLELPADVRGRTISFEISNAQLDEQMEITGIGVQVDEEVLDIRPYTQ